MAVLLPRYVLKSEPDVWSWQQQVARGEQGEPWTGVRNHQAQAIMRAMQVGEHAFFYHSQHGKCIVGVVEVITPFTPDPTDTTHKFGMVQVAARYALPQPVTLTQIKAMPICANIGLVRQSRLSVSGIDEAAAAAVLRLSGIGIT